MEATARGGVPSETARTSGHEILVAGAAAGVAGGVLMALSLVIGAAANDVSPLSPFRAMGATFVEADTGEVGPGLLLYGLALHLAASVLLAVLYTAMLPRDLPAMSAAVAGVGYAWGVMAIATSLVLPLVNPEMRGEMRLIGGSWVIAHGVYGLALGLAPPLRRRLAGGAHPRQPR